MIREKEEYKEIPIRLKGTNKTTKANHKEKEWGRKQIQKGGNCLDTVRGCPAYKNQEYPRCRWDCYSEEAVRRYKKIFGKPVKMILKEELLRKDLKKCKERWIRIGVDGAPSWDWELTTRCAEIVAEKGKTPVIITRMWKRPTERQIERMIRRETILNITVSAVDEKEELRERVKLAEEYQEKGGKVALRVVTFAFKEKDERWEKQGELMRGKIQTLEQPARILRKTEKTRRKNSMWEEVERERYKPYQSYMTGKKNARWRTAGKLYEGKACISACPECEIKCMVRVLKEKKKQTLDFFLTELVSESPEGEILGSVSS